MADMQCYPSHHDDDRREAISDLIFSVAEEQEALARILDAEHEKIEKAADMRGVDVDDLVEIDKSVQRIIEAHPPRLMAPSTNIDRASLVVLN